MAMPEPPEGYEWEVRLGNAQPGFYARAHVFLQPVPDAVADMVYSVPVYDEGFEAIEAAAAQMVKDVELADALYAKRAQTAREWTEALGCKVVP